MISFCIAADVLGTTKHLLCDGDAYKWIAEVPENVLYFTGTLKYLNDWCFDSLLKLANIIIDISPPLKYVNAMHTVLGVPNRPLPWSYIMPLYEHQAFVKKIIKQLVDNLPLLPYEYFKTIWSVGNSVLRMLQPASINITRYNELIESNVGNISTVKTFKVINQNFAHPVIYNRFGTITGRLTVASGPNILTLKRDYRNLLQSSFKNGHIVYVDFAGLEPRVILYEAGKDCKELDLYASIAAELNRNRNVVKGAIISEIYGSTRQTLGNSIGITGVELDEFVNKVSTYFNTKELLQKIKSGFITTGVIHNAYGRPVTIQEPLNHIFINYYTQSTGADIALLGFADILQRLNTLAPIVKPLFVLVDALILDVPDECLEIVQSINSVVVPHYKQTFPVKVELLA